MMSPLPARDPRPVAQEQPAVPAPAQGAALALSFLGLCPRHFPPRAVLRPALRLPAAVLHRLTLHQCLRTLPRRSQHRR